ncbi:PhoPQ-activated pathogenicity-related family protein [Thalassoroseus pseudoceratinae]|uniref:PhoPQ-activated pathogenicity-related family protein n=1 Tax=Thalassoroseus pseudoceratinae TaxID=2713176 RepID=UPI0014247495|nr:PhoPQ-activated protein PqaA family protein [Thalassoroseus pseudoceratinae]
MPIKLTRLSAFVVLLAIVGGVTGPDVAVAEDKNTTTALHTYVNAKDDSYKWNLVKSEKLPNGLGQLHTLNLVSQTWQGIVWNHVLAIFEPADLKFPEHGLLFVTGGRTGSELRDGDKAMGAELARLTGTRCMILLQVPNQPLFGDHYEDDLITETFLKYLDTHDATWPLLFPMVKSAVRAFDATAEFSKETSGHEVNKFVVTGASKRGWTSWLTGVVEPRVIGIAPMVIDTLNFAKQTRYQIKIWGKYSEQIKDYTSKGLVDLIEEEPQNPLFSWVDPYTYRKRLTLPKLLINGTNDPYWVVDALNNYWDDLQGEKFILYIPNAGHGLKGGREKVVRTVAAFTLHQMTQTPLPKLSWKFSQSGDKLKLTIESSSPAENVSLWTANSDDLDFRDDQWSSQAMKQTKSGAYQASTPLPAEDNIAAYGDLEFKIHGVPYSLCTQIRRTRANLALGQ